MLVGSAVKLKVPSAPTKTDQRSRRTYPEGLDLKHLVPDRKTMWRRLHKRSREALVKQVAFKN